MNKFEEMQLRCIKFHQRVKECSLLLTNTLIVLKCSQTMFEYDGNEYKSGGETLSESQWISGINNELCNTGINAQFPTLLEALGWCSRINKQPEPWELVIFRTDESIGTGFLDDTGKIKWPYGTIWTHWQPIPQFIT